MLTVSVLTGASGRGKAIPALRNATNSIHSYDGQIHYQFFTEAVKPPEDTAQASVSDYTGVIVGGQELTAMPEHRRSIVQ